MKQFQISEQEIAEYMFQELTDLGFVPGEKEIEAIAEIAFDYFCTKAAEEGLLEYVGEGEDTDD